MTRQWNRIPNWGRKLMVAAVLAGLLFLLPAGNNQVAAQDGCRAYHVVQYGENLFRISLRYGTTVPVLAAANNISNPHWIYAGQTLCIPGDGGTGGLPENGTVVNCYYLNVRSGPAVIYNVLEIVEQGAQLEVLGRNYYATWVQVRTPSGIVGWVNGYYIYTGVPIYNLPIVG